MSSSATVLLRPRPYAQDPAVLLLLPLLSTPKVVTLPSELWLFIFQLVAAQSTSGLLPLLTVCRNFKVRSTPNNNNVLLIVPGFTCSCVVLRCAAAQTPSVSKVLFSCPPRRPDLECFAQKSFERSRSMGSILGSFNGSYYRSRGCTGLRILAHRPLSQHPIDDPSSVMSFSSFGKTCSLDSG